MTRRQESAASGTMVGITGTPGTGKKSVAPMVAAALGLPCLGLPRLRGASAATSMEGIPVDTESVRRGLVRHPPGRSVAFGHLLPHLLPPEMVSRVVVLRCEPAVLRGRLEGRGYAPLKVLENVEAELIGVIADEAFRSFGPRKTFEIDTTSSTPRGAAGAILRQIRSPTTVPRTDWLRSYGSASKLTSLLGSPGRRPG